MSTSDSSSNCVECGLGEGGPMIQCGKCREKHHAKCVQVDEAHAKRIVKYECEKCADDGMEIFEYDMRNIVASSSRKLRISQEKLVTAGGSQNLKAKLVGPTSESLGKPTPKPPGRAFVHRGYRYCNEKKGAELALWDCSKKDAGCEVRLFRKMVSGRVLRVTNEHNHPPMESTRAENAASSASAKMASNAADSSMSSDSISQPWKPSPAKAGFRHKGYVYNREHPSKDGTKQFWTCKEVKRMKCTARLHTSVDNGEVIAELGEHTHPPPETPKAEDDAISTDGDRPESSAHITFSAKHVAKPAFVQRGLRHKGYEYWHHSLSKTGTTRYWFCKQKRTIQCPARIDTTASGDVVQVLGQHNHQTSERLLSSSKLKTPASSSTSATKPSPCDPSIRHNGFLYHHDQLSKDGTRHYWYCSQKSKLRCLARVHTSIDSGEVVHVVGQHVHKPVDRVDKKAIECKPEDTPKAGGHSMRRRTLGTDRQHAGHPTSKKPRASVSVDMNNNGTPISESAPPSANNAPSAVTVVQRLMGLEPAKRVSATILFNSLLDEMETDGR